MIVVGAATVLLWTLAAVTMSAAWRVAGELAHASNLAEIGPHPQTTVVYDRNNRPAFSFYLEQRIDVPLDRVSPHMIDALLAVEDRRFYKHHGLDLARIFKAAWRDWRAGRILEGGSTITQQLARIEQLNASRTFDRKIREATIAVRLEERYSKAQILGAYLNAVYFGDGYYGVEAASRGYFGKPAAELEPQEAALLAALVRSPTHYSPSADPKRALDRRNLVLRLMRDTGRLSAGDYRVAIDKPLRPAAAGDTVLASRDKCGQYYQEEVRRQLVAHFGGKQVLRGGLRVYTGYDPEMQCAAEKSINTRIAQIAKITKGSKNTKDLEGSLVALDPSSGEVRAMVGGRDFDSTSFNRATQSRRQPGSAFKPIIYAAALERGMSPASIINNLDEPIMTDKGPWLPGGEHESSEYSLRTALKISSNRAAAQLLQQVGITQATYYAQRLGIESRLPNVPSLALGTGGVTLLELTSAYGVFANQGVAVRPHLITRVDDGEGTAIWNEVADRHQAVTAATAFLMTSMLADVITSGTATSARAAGFKLPAAGKTGTADDYTDAWFVGYTPHLVTGVWFGVDKPAPIMNRGFAAVVAVPAWADFMKQATAKDKPDWFTTPPDVEKVAICRLSGQLATDGCRRAATEPEYEQTNFTDEYGQPVFLARPPQTAPKSYVYEDYFYIGSAPSQPCPIHGYSGTRPGIDGAVGTAGTVPASYTPGAPTPAPTSAPTSPPTSNIQRIVGPDGRVTFIIRQD